MKTLTPQKAKNGKWGYVNEGGKWVIKAKFDLAKAFINGTAIVKVGDKYGIIDEKGSYVYTPVLDDAWSWEEFIVARPGENDEYWEETETAWGIMDRYGEWIHAPHYAQIEGDTKDFQASNIINHDFLVMWDDGDGQKLFSGGDMTDYDDDDEGYDDEEDEDYDEEEEEEEED